MLCQQMSVHSYWKDATSKFIFHSLPHLVIPLSKSKLSILASIHLGRRGHLEDAREMPEVHRASSDRYRVCSSPDVEYIGSPHACCTHVAGLLFERSFYENNQRAVTRQLSCCDKLIDEAQRQQIFDSGERIPATPWVRSTEEDPYKCH